MAAKRHAEIVGAGMSGLTLATALAQTGWTVRIHETAPEVRMLGAAIHLWNNGLLVLEAIGAFEETMERSDPIRDWRYYDERKRLLIHHRLGTGKDRLYLPPRPTLNRALLRAAQGAGVEVVTSSTGVAATPDGTVVFENGDRVKADLVVAADGHRSPIREGLGLTRKFVEQVGASTRFLLPVSVYTPGPAVDCYVSGHRRLMVGGSSDEFTYLALGSEWKDSSAGEIPLNKDYWLRAYPDHAPLIEAVAEMSREPGVCRRDRFTYVSIKSWSAGKIAIIGDAAHAQPPNLAQGANISFQNALSLAVMLDDTTDVPAALNQWEETQRPLTDHVQRWTNIFGFMTESWPPALREVRSAVVRLTNKSAWLGGKLNRAADSTPLGTEAIAARYLPKPAEGRS